MKLVVLALAPVVLIALYIYCRDKYEKEPLGMLIKAFVAGCLVPIPVLLLGGVFMRFTPTDPGWQAFYNAFLIAGTFEEVFKFIFLFLLIWKNQNFNEKFDGIVYAVFVSLGFAAVENILYVYQYGESVAYIRAILSVPAHAIFGIIMGYYLGLAKFYPIPRKVLVIKAIAFPILLHGIFDFILMKNDARLLLMFIPFVVYLYYDGLRKIRNLSTRSIYKVKSIIL